MSAFSSVGLSDAVCDEVAARAWQHRLTAPRRAPVHPLVLASAKKRITADGFRVEEGRLGSWINTTRIFHMTHIAKTGGRSVRLELLRLVRPVGGAEQCYPPFAHESRVNIIFFREPRGHALSQYLHGAYAGRSARRRASGYPVVQGDDLTGFARWVAHFARDWTPSRGDFFGYNPLNMMARTLTCTDERWNCSSAKPCGSSHHSLPRPRAAHPFLHPGDYLKQCEGPCAHHVGNSVLDASPPIAPAIAAVHSTDFVGVLELLPESLCVIAYRKRGELPPHCACPDSDGAQHTASQSPRIAHVMNSRRQRAARKVSVSQSSPEVLRELDAMTKVDARVYRAAVLRLLCDLRALERRTGKQLICMPRIEALRNKTRYVPGLWDGSGAASMASEWKTAV